MKKNREKVEKFVERRWGNFYREMGESWEMNEKDIYRTLFQRTHLFFFKFGQLPADWPAANV
jgi:hypothetical protein